MIALLAPGENVHADISINELRIDQPGEDTDEFFELAGPPAASLDGLSYVVLGDGRGGGSGVVEVSIDLSGYQLSDTGHFVVAESGFSLQSGVLLATLNFENGDNVTHLLVRGSSARVGDDLDWDDDGVLDLQPWDAVVDAVALLEEQPPRSTEFAYPLGDVLGPVSGIAIAEEGSSRGLGVPAHALRCPDRVGPWIAGAFDPSLGLDSPGFANRCQLLEPQMLRIFEIQGRAHRSPVAGRMVTTAGVVTAVDANGFYLQDPEGDTDPDTSDALFVFTRTPPEVTVGEHVRVSGGVAEFVPGGLSTQNLSVTEIRAMQVLRLGPPIGLPEPVVLGHASRRPPTRVIDDDAFASFEPEEDGLDFFESLEAMRVALAAANVVGPTDSLGRTTVVAAHAGVVSGRSIRGTLNVAPADLNPERIALVFDRDLVDQPSPRLGVGARFERLEGVIGYAFGRFDLRVTRPSEARWQGRLHPEVSRLVDEPGSLRIATLNVKNLDPNDADGDADLRNGRFDALGEVVARSLAAPAILALQEVQDGDGRADTGLVSAARTLSELTAAIQRAGGPLYKAIDPGALSPGDCFEACLDGRLLGDARSGGQPGGNIRVVLLYDPERVERVPDSVRSLVDPIEQQSDPASPFFRARPPLVARFRVDGQELTVVNVHLTSKSGSAPLLGALQPATELQEDRRVNAGVDRRREQARVIADYVRQRLSQEPEARIVVLGDFNEFEFVSPLSQVLGQQLFNLTYALPRNERYSFIFEGNSASLDHILVTRSLRAGARVDAVHVHCEFVDSPARGSDHDPVLARLRLRPPVRRSPRSGEPAATEGRSRREASITACGWRAPR